MKKPYSGFFARLGVVLAILAAWTLFSGEALAQQGPYKGRHYNRPAVTKDAIRHQQAKRAYVAGAVSQQRRANRERAAYAAGARHEYRRERARDYYDDRYRRDRYYRDRYDDDRDSNDLNRVLIGVAVGAVATAVIMNSNDAKD